MRLRDMVERFRPRLIPDLLLMRVVLRVARPRVRTERRVRLRDRRAYDMWGNVRQSPQKRLGRLVIQGVRSGKMCNKNGARDLGMLGKFRHKWGRVNA